MICCDSLCYAFLSFNQFHSSLNWSLLRFSLRFWNLTSLFEAFLKLLKRPFEGSELLLKLFKSSLLTFGADFCRSLWPFNIFRRSFLGPFCILRLEFADLCFFFHILIVPIWLLSGLAGYFFTLTSAFPLSLRQRYCSINMQVRQGLYIFSMI